MVIISMLLAMGVFLVILVGIILFVIGLILDIIWIVKAAKQKKAHIVLKVFAVLLTVIGLCTALFPILIMRVGSDLKSARYNSEISGYTDDEIAHVSHYLYLDQGFSYKGTKYVDCGDDLHVPYSKDELDAVGAIEYDDGKHTILYKLPSVASDNLICTENGVFCPENEFEDVMSYYRDEAPLKCKISLYEEKRYRDWAASDLDSDKIREMRQYLLDNGTKDTTQLDEGFKDAIKGSYDFYSEDDVYRFTMILRIKDDEIEADYDKYHAVLPESYSQYIRENLPE
ncbi:MAG: hypothetical protein J5517_10295 [Eubacterium sp.]|nr:hypothetical protein [Eubacterium sp.]